MLGVGCGRELWWKIGQVQIHDKFGRTALVHACDQSCPEVVQFLLEAGADVNEAYVAQHTLTLHVNCV
jgi:ankyrin repeat protein